jgi:hypothetical protein
MKLVHNWRQAWRWWSVRVSALGAALSALAIGAPDLILSAWSNLPPDAREALPFRLSMIVPTILFALNILARILKQRERHDG